MSQTSVTRATIAILCTFLFLIFAFPAEAQFSGRGERYSSSMQRKINDLDNDEVKNLPIPILFGVSLTNIFPNFGDPRDGGARSHEGEDIMAKLGTPIVSPTEAVVTRTGSGGSTGNFVRTANPGGETFVYMHLDEIANIKSGDVLKVGDFIGTVGDTGNAKGGPAHLHWEIRDGSAKDPYPRITEVFTLEEKMEFVNAMFEDLDDEDEMAAFLVGNYTSEFRQAVNAGYELPSEVEAELKKKGIVSTADLQKTLDSIIATIPKVVTTDFALNAQGSGVSLIQFYLIYQKTGPAALTLAQSGPTGTFGPATQAALIEYQLTAKITPTGMYDAATRKAMLDS